MVRLPKSGNRPVHPDPCPVLHRRQPWKGHCFPDSPRPGRFYVEKGGIQGKLRVLYIQIRTVNHLIPAERPLDKIDPQVIPSWSAIFGSIIVRICVIKPAVNPSGVSGFQRMNDFSSGGRRGLGFSLGWQRLKRGCQRFHSQGLVLGRVLLSVQPGRFR